MPYGRDKKSTFVKKLFIAIATAMTQKRFFTTASFFLPSEIRLGFLEVPINFEAHYIVLFIKKRSKKFY
jgi:low temperature requirement protein LtrA